MSKGYVAVNTDRHEFCMVVKCLRWLLYSDEFHFIVPSCIINQLYKTRGEVDTGLGSAPLNASNETPLDSCWSCRLLRSVEMWRHVSSFVHWSSFILNSFQHLMWSITWSSEVKNSTLVLMLSGKIRTLKESKTLLNKVEVGGRRATTNSTAASLRNSHLVTEGHLQTFCCWDSYFHITAPQLRAPNLHSHQKIVLLDKMQ